MVLGLLSALVAARRVLAIDPIDMARRSTNEQLREQGAYLERMILGPRESSGPAQSQPGPAAAPSAAAQEDIDRHRAAVMHKYKVGLR